MEALAAVIGVVGPVCEAASKIFETVSAVRSSTGNIRRLRQRIELLRHALEGVRGACSLRQGRRLLPPERFHYKSISTILQGCQNSLFTLERQLPTVPANPSLGYQIALAIEQKMNQDDVNQAIDDIKHYTTVLNLTLSSLSL